MRNLKGVSMISRFKRILFVLINAQVLPLSTLYAMEDSLSKSQYEAGGLLAHYKDKSSIQQSQEQDRLLQGGICSTALRRFCRWSKRRLLD